MELNHVRDKAMTIIKKYRYGILILLLGIGLMILPSGQENGEYADVEQETQSTSETPALSSQLEEILSQIRGAGEVRVLLTCEEGAQTVYQTDMQSESGEKELSEHSQTVLISDGNGGEKGLVMQTIPQTYRGAIVLSRGADVPSVCLAIIEAVANVTGLGTDRVSVLKMK
jgi:stage III sporulation protein AG